MHFTANQLLLLTPPPLAWIFFCSDDQRREWARPSTSLRIRAMISTTTRVVPGEKRMSFQKTSPASRPLCFCEMRSRSFLKVGHSVDLYNFYERWIKEKSKKGIDLWTNGIYLRMIIFLQCKQVSESPASMKEFNERTYTRARAFSL